MMDTKTHLGKCFTNRSTFRLLFLYINLFTIYLSYGQQGLKNKITPEEYHKWGTLWPEKISEKGNWASFVMRYHSGNDTLFVKHTKRGINYSYPGGTSGSFGGDDAFALQIKDTLILLNLSYGKLQKIPGIERYFFDKSGKYVIVYKIEKAQKKLLVLNTDGILLRDYGLVTSTTFNHDRTALVYCTLENSKMNAGIIYFQKTIKEETIPIMDKGALVNAVWKGNTIAFTNENLSSKLFSYNITSKKVLTFSAKSFPPESYISNQFGNLYISDDEKKIFFRVKEKVTQPIHEKVQVWNSHDNRLYWNILRLGKKKKGDYDAVWFPNESRSYNLTDSLYRFEGLNATADILVSSIPGPNIADGKEVRERSIWLQDIRNTWKRKIIENYTGELISSPDGNYLIYAIKGNWWIYNIKRDKHFNLTGNILASFDKESHNKPEPAPMHGFGGWVNNNKSLLLYDMYDVWEVPLDGQKAKRITRGREINTTYRILPTLKMENMMLEFSNRISGRFDMEKGFVLTCYNHNSETTGYGYWKKKGIRQLVAPNYKTTHFTRAEHNQGFIFMQQDFQTPRRLMYQGHLSSQPVTLYQSNAHQSNYQWGTAEKISYNYKGKKLSAAVFYPSGFDRSKKYPMIVHVYERQAPYLNDYVIPSFFESSGFNYTNYVCEGYVVMLPDIVYEIGDTGKSAVECVNAGLDAMVARGAIDPAAIGLIGHSFGGYETDIILTHSDRFRAAVSGAAWTDLVSAYHTIGTGTMTADYWRFEEDQLRIGKSIYEDPMPYLNNSPILRAHKINTPLLSWVGSDDPTINALQSIEFYLALRRLGKEHILLYYPGEQHGLIQPDNAKDLSSRILQWFNYYLKGEEKLPWMFPK